MNPLSVTANEAKLLKHLDRLTLLQAGRAAPVLLCVAPTNRCQLACPHCCFRERDRALELPFPVLWEATEAFLDLGVKSVELTGGGEPGLYPHLEMYVGMLGECGIPAGLNTNGRRIEGVPWEFFEWVRLNANVWTPQAAEVVRNWAKSTSACFVAGRESRFSELVRVADVAEHLRIPTRIAPDCQLPRGALMGLLERLRDDLLLLGDRGGYVFLSDFNTPLEPRKDDRCWMHLVKPFLWPDGWVYCCPSAELALENGSDVAEEFRVCRAEDVARYYRTKEAIEPRHHKCSFCKYARQNALVSAVMERTEFNAFC